VFYVFCLYACGIGNQRKENLMSVTVTNNDNSTTTYGYDPEHYESVVAFYQDLVEQKKILAFAVDA